MKMRKKTSLLMILFFAALSFLPAASFAEPVEILSFEPGDTIEEIRAKIEHNGYEFTVDNNWVFDMPDAEKREFFSRSAPLLPQMLDSYGESSPSARHLGERQLPSSFDWRNYNGHSYIGPIRDQGSCGACYAFGASAAAEGAYNWANGKYDGNCADFSEAFVAFCLSDYYSGFDGCSGSDYDYQELTGLVNYGVCNDNVYPYTDHEQACQASSWDTPRTTFHSWHRVGCNDIDAIKTAIMTYGVIDAAVYVGSAFQAYSGGIYQDSKTSCPSDPCYYSETNHIISLVGWNDNGGDGYWILRNSWGTDWGEDGYMRIKYTSARVACGTAYLVYKSLAAPVLTVTTAGTTVALSWTTVNSATGYTLLYAPYPFTGLSSIVSVDMGTQPGISINLWKGAAFWVAIQAYNSGGSSDFSNIEYFIIDSSVSVVPASLNLPVGGTDTCTMSGGTSPYSASSNKTSVATGFVSGSTLTVTGVSAGSATITVGDSVGDSATVSVTVSDGFAEITGKWTFTYTIISSFTRHYDINADGTIYDLGSSSHSPTIGNQGYTVLGGNYEYYVYGGLGSMIDRHFFFNYVSQTDKLAGIYVQTDPGGNPHDPSEIPFPMTGDRYYGSSIPTDSFGEYQTEEREFKESQP